MVAIKKRSGVSVLVWLMIVGMLSIQHISAQPNITPAPNYTWVNVGSATYSTSVQQTIPNLSTQGADTSYGESGDSDPSSCTLYCGGNCDGVSTIEQLVFGTSSLPSSSCEQRAVDIPHWNNPFPESAISNGASVGQVYLPTEATVYIDGLTTGAGGDENRGWIIGGSGAPNESRFRGTVTYSMDWHIADYSLSGASGDQVVTGEYQWTDPGNSNEEETFGWFNATTDGFGMSFSDELVVPTASIVQTGGMMEVIFEANSAIAVSRIFGNADGRIQHGPGMEGGARYEVGYDIWQLEVAMPVTYNFIKVAGMSGAVQIQWQTAREVNSYSFEVEKSEDDSWQQIGELPAAGNINVPQDYRLVDSRPFAGNNYYRIRQIDKGGAEHLSSVHHVRYETQGHLDIALSPNPAKDYVRIIGLPGERSTYRIIDLSGSEVAIGSISDGDEISLGALKSGVYYLMLDQLTTSQKIHKVIKL